MRTLEKDPKNKATMGRRCFLVRKLNVPLRTCAPTHYAVGFALRCVHAHFSMRICIEMCVSTLLNANPMVGVLGAHALKGKKTAFVS